MHLYDNYFNPHNLLTCPQCAHDFQDNDLLQSKVNCFISGLELAEKCAEETATLFSRQVCMYGN